MDIKTLKRIIVDAFLNTEVPKDYSSEQVGYYINRDVNYYIEKKLEPYILEYRQHGGKGLPLEKFLSLIYNHYSLREDIREEAAMSLNCRLVGYASYGPEMVFRDLVPKEWFND